MSGSRFHIGLTGPMASGKGEAVAVLEQLGFKYVSLSDLVRERAALQPGPVDRAAMQKIGNELRRRGGAGVLGGMIRELVESGPEKKWVIDGIRNPAEVNELRRLPRFFLLGVTADPEVILARMRSRSRPGDPFDEEAARLVLAREWGEGQAEDGQQVGRCLEKADFTISNNGGLEEFRAAVRALALSLEDQHEN